MHARTGFKGVIAGGRGGVGRSRVRFDQLSFFSPFLRRPDRSTADLRFRLRALSISQLKPFPHGNRTSLSLSFLPRDRGHSPKRGRTKTDSFVSKSIFGFDSFSFLFLFLPAFVFLRALSVLGSQPRDKALLSLARLLSRHPFIFKQSLAESSRPPKFLQWSRSKSISRRTTSDTQGHLLFRSTPRRTRNIYSIVRTSYCL